MIDMIPSLELLFLFQADKNGPSFQTTFEKTEQTFKVRNYIK